MNTVRSKTTKLLRAGLLALTFSVVATGLAGRGLVSPALGDREATRSVPGLPQTCPETSPRCNNPKASPDVWREGTTAEVEYTASQGHSCSVFLHVLANGKEIGATGGAAPGATVGTAVTLPASRSGKVTLSFDAELTGGQSAGCSGNLGSWGGTITIDGTLAEDDFEITARVIDATGKFLSGRTVMVNPAGPAEPRFETTRAGGTVQFLLSSRTVERADGEFLVSVGPSATEARTVFDCSGQEVPGGRCRVELTKRRPSASADFRLAHYTIGGVVFQAETGNPLPGRKVVINAVGPQEAKGVKTDSSGEYGVRIARSIVNEAKNGEFKVSVDLNPGEKATCGSAGAECFVELTRQRPAKRVNFKISG